VSAIAGDKDDETLVLPALRSDLRLAPAAPDTDGSPMWTLFDPLRNQYFHVHVQGLRLIRHWRAGATAGDIANDITADGVPMRADEVAGMARFMAASNLTAAGAPSDTARLVDQARRAHTTWYAWIMHRYLFFRIPLVRPDAFLVRWLPQARKLIARPMRWALVVIGLLGFYLAGRQWGEFTSTFVHFLSWEGLVWYGMALMVVKSAHELGHAFVAKHFGCRVPSMGVAFLVMVPMLYTDATDTWRLIKDRDRLKVSLAGVCTELVIAVLATCAWGLLPDGGLRQAAFFLATTSWIATVLVNLSPFMRFDGYHVLADLWGIRNLQPRAFALTRWRLREAVFGFGEAPPEAFAPRRRRLLVAYAIGTWVYRFFLFLGIALLVYHFAFKILGIVLFCIEIGYFIVRPIVNELREVWDRKWPLNRSLVRTGLILVGLLALLFIPWHGTVALPSVMVAADHTEIHAPEAARIRSVAVTAGDRVKKGDTLFVLESPDLVEKIAEDRERIRVIETRLARRAGSPEDLAASGVLERQRAELNAQIAGFKKRQDALAITAPFAGRITDRAPLHAGEWVNPRQALAQVVAAGGARVYGYVEEGQLGRIAVDAPGRFIPDDGIHAAVDLHVADIDDAANEQLAYPILADRHGGHLATVQAPNDGSTRGDERPTLDGGQYRVTMAPTEATAAPEWQIRGEARVQGPAESIAGAIFRNAAGVFIRESGF
tara:strand:- start:317 stop:2467 length:2151 start_codon:yes stop_codon:yes gene_type:complete